MLSKEQYKIADAILSLIKKNDKNNNFISELDFNTALEKYDEAELNFVVFFMSSELNLLKKWERNDTDFISFEYLLLTKTGIKAAKIGMNGFILMTGFWNRLNSFKNWVAFILSVALTIYQLSKMFN